MSEKFEKLGLYTAINLPSSPNSPHCALGTGVRPYESLKSKNAKKTKKQRKKGNKKFEKLCLYTVINLPLP